MGVSHAVRACQRSGINTSALARRSSTQIALYAQIAAVEPVVSSSAMWRECSCIQASASRYTRISSSCKTTQIPRFCGMPLRPAII
jgi:hypothetical protein